MCFSMPKMLSQFFEIFPRAGVTALGVAFVVLIARTDVFASPISDIATRFSNAEPQISEESLGRWMTGITRASKSGYDYVMWDLQKDGPPGNVSQSLVQSAAIALACVSETSNPLVKVDVIRLKDQDSYGKPRWDTAERIAHIEIPTERCSKVRLQGTPLTVAEIQNIPSLTKFTK